MIKISIKSVCYNQSRPAKWIPPPLYNKKTGNARSERSQMKRTIVSGSGEAQDLKLVNYVCASATSKIQSGREWAHNFARRRPD